MATGMPSHDSLSLQRLRAVAALMQSNRRVRPVHKRHPPVPTPSARVKISPAIPRIFLSTPGLPQSENPIQLSNSSLRKLRNALHHGWATSTATNYGYAVDRFLRFCDAENIPSHLRLPTDEFVLCAFAASGAGIHAGSTARNNIAALKAWHIAQNQ
ncbi:hypothetical protein C8F01DRAFT_1286843 [Mycena amicta]|nr:hypothetical protein C8F01DRAFT_1286843 [Mycena amicta]